MATTSSNRDGSVSDQTVAYYHKRARGGVGTIILEYTSVDYPFGLGATTQLQLKDPQVVPGFRKILDAVEPYGTTLLVQLHHAGSRAAAHPEAYRVGPVGREGVHELTKSDIAELVGKYVNSAKLAQKAGLHGVEIHAGHGYLISEFLSPLTNTRNDEYGGSTENRSRILVEIIRAVREAVGSNFIISVRLTVKDWNPAGMKLEEGIEYAKIIDQEDIDLINVTTGVRFEHFGGSETQERPDGNRLDLAEAIKPNVKHPIAIVGKLRTGKMCNEVIESGTADLVVVGRQLIADPEWPNKIKRGDEQLIRVCLNCMDGCYSAIGIDSGMRCAISPYVGYEAQFDEGSLPTVRHPERVVVVGGGVTGMQAALTSAQRGNQVTLVSDEPLGGQLRLAAKIPAKEILNTMVPYYRAEFEREGVEVIENTRATLDSVKEMNPDTVIVATGSVPLVAPIPGHETTVGSWDVIDGKVKIEPGQKVAIIGGGSVGCDTALLLLEQGVKDIAILEMTKVFAAGQESNHRLRDLNKLERAGVQMIGQAQIQQINNDSVVYLDAADHEQSVPVDVVVMSTGQRAVDNGLAEGLEAAGVQVKRAGDALAIGNIRSNVRSGFFVGYGY